MPVQSEIRVYPNLLSERKSLAALFLNRGAFGVHAQRQVGKGRDFEKFREYVPGDDYDEIHWKATARRGKPITKVFQIEKTQEVYVIVDASRLSARKSGSRSKFKVAVPETLNLDFDLEPGTRPGTLRHRRAGARTGGGAAGRFVRSADVHGQGGKICARAKTARPITAPAATRFTRCSRKSSRRISTSCARSSGCGCAAARCWCF